MKKILFLTIALFIIGTGCSIKSNIFSLSEKENQYQMKVIKSEVNKNLITVNSKKNPAIISELLSDKNCNAQVDIRDNKQVVTRLDNVIATAAKKWNLFINDQLIQPDDLFDIRVKPTDKIEWRYEKI